MHWRYVKKRKRKRGKRNDKVCVLHSHIYSYKEERRAREGLKPGLFRCFFLSSFFLRVAVISNRGERVGDDTEMNEAITDTTGGVDIFAYNHTILGSLVLLNQLAVQTREAGKHLALRDPRVHGEEHFEDTTFVSVEPVRAGSGEVG